ncbi:MAG: PorT family protein [Bacteroidales bacterium]|nr:PorT family protein [Bacteroidales bacterium]
MKRLFIFLLILFTTLVSMLAQTHYEGNCFIGAKAGMSMSRVQFNPNVRQGMLFTPMAGVTFRYIEENHFGLIGELNFEQRGWKEDFEDASQFHYSRTLSYLQIPVLAHIYFGSSRAHFFINAGPEIGFRIASSTSANFDPEQVQTIPGFPLKDRQIAQLTEPLGSAVDFGISGGLGMEYFLNSRNSLNLEARFYYGLGNIMKCGRTEAFSAANTMQIMLTLGYSFRLK